MLAASLPAPAVPARAPTAAPADQAACDVWRGPGWGLCGQLQHGNGNENAHAPRAPLLRRARPRAWRCRETLPTDNMAASVDQWVLGWSKQQIMCIKSSARGLRPRLLQLPHVACHVYKPLSSPPGLPDQSLLNCILSLRSRHGRCGTMTSPGSLVGGDLGEGSFSCAICCDLLLDPVVGGWSGGASPGRGGASRHVRMACDATCCPGVRFAPRQKA